MKYKFIDEIKSDVLYEAYGKDLKELFENAAEAMFTIICQIEKVKDEKSVDIEVQGKNLRETMWNWLSELIATVDIEHMFFSKFDIIEISETHVKAKIYGEEALPEKGETVVKSLTNYKFDVEKKSKSYKAIISLDI